MKDKPEINEREAEERIKGMGRHARVVVHDDGIVRATAISADPSDTRIQNEVEGLLEKIQQQYSIVKKKKTPTAKWR